MANSLIKPRQKMAMGGAGGDSNFGIAKTLGGVPPVSNSNRGMAHAPMGDNDRAPPISRGGKKLHSQRHPDHGPHSY